MSLGDHFFTAHSQEWCNLRPMACGISHGISVGDSCRGCFPISAIYPPVIQHSFGTWPYIVDFPKEIAFFLNSYVKLPEGIDVT